MPTRMSSVYCRGGGQASAARAALAEFRLAQQARHGDGLDSRVHAELAQDALGVAVDGVLGEEQLARDLPRRVAGTDQVENLPLTRRERALDRPHAAAVLGRGAQQLNQVVGQGTAYRRLAGGDRA